MADQVLKNPKSDANYVTMAANLFLQLNNVPKVEESLRRLVQLSPESAEAWFDLAAIQAVINKIPDSLKSLDTALKLSGQRRVSDTNAPDLHGVAQTDPRFNVLRGNPDFQKVIDQNKPPR